MGIHDEASATDESLRKVFAPEGWHVPSENDWDTLKNYLSSNGYNYDGTVIGNRIARSMASNSGWKSDDTTGWPGHDQITNNRSGFNAFPHGSRLHYGHFYYAGEYAYFWSSTNDSDTGANGYGLNYSSSSLRVGPQSKKIGCSVRFVRD